jgi:glycosyltransferase involved in cell wall biosynthesis
LAQTWSNLEVFLVDDGSTDNSAVIIKGYQERYPKIIKSIFQKNAGQASARNAALAKMTGAYVSFVDSDDWILPEMHDSLYHALVNTNAQIALSDFQTINEYDDITGNYSSGDISVAGEDVKGNEARIVAVVPQVTGKLFDAKLFLQGENRFPEGIWYEDLALLPLLVLSAKRIVKVESYFYRYFKREGSTTTSFTIKVLDALLALEFIDKNLSLSCEGFLQPLKHRTCYITAVRLCEVVNDTDRHKGFTKLEHYVQQNIVNRPQTKKFPLVERFVVFLLKHGFHNLLYFSKKAKRLIKNH